jgi:hypothetical protein
MLEKLLSEIQRGGTLPPQVLAARLNISLPMVEMMLEDLQRRGLITLLDSECSGKACGGCAVGDFCTTQGSEKARIWILSKQR